MAVNVIGFHVTDRCQLDCAHCFRDPSQKPTDIDVDLVRRVLGDARRLYRVRHVSLTGGEPTLHPNFFALVDAAIDEGCTWNVVTNGKRFAMLVDGLHTRALRRANLTHVSLSIDGADEATHDTIRGAGSYRDVMTAVTLCEVHDVPWVAQIVVNARNVQDIESIAMAVSQLGARRLSYVMMQPTGTHHDKDLYLSPRAWRDVQTRIDRVASTMRMPVAAAEGFPQTQPFHTCPPFASEQMHVDVHGRLTLCCQHSDLPAAGREDDVAADLHTTPLLEAHGRFLDIVHAAQKDRLADLATSDRGEWDAFACNDCMRRFGKPHWVEGGVGGPAAERERWRGAWAPRRLPVIS